MKKSTNSNTEHSKQLRAQTAAEWRKEQMKAGKLFNVGIALNKEEMDIVKAIKEKTGLSYRELFMKAIKLLDC